MTVENQTISALIDGEAGFPEGCVYIDHSASSPMPGATASRYQLIGACLRGDSVIDTSGLFERIHNQLQDEPTILAPAAMNRDNAIGKKRVAGFAVAASVAAAVVFTVFRTQLPAETVLVETSPVSETRALDAAPALAAMNAVSSAPAQETISQVDIDTGNPDLDRYLRQHQDYIGSGAFGPGFATATMVSYDGR